MSSHSTTHISEDRYYLESLGLQVVKIGGIAGLVLLALGFVLSLTFGHGVKQFLFSYLTAFCYFLSISLGAFFFVLIHHLSRAGWSVVVRRIAEILAANVSLLIILFIPILFGLGELYHWTHGDIVAQDPILLAKKPYLNVPFFLFRCVVYFALWFIFTRFLLNRSLQQDQSGDPALSLKMEKISAPGILLFALTLTFASIDLLMTLDPHWFSTMFGVYYFAGCMVSFFAAIVAILFLLQRSGRLSHTITTEHYHDLGKFLFAFVFFWGYIAFSQYMLIWYANIPEETNWYLRRQTGGWAWLGIALILFHFVIPFAGLISRTPKRKKTLLFFWAVWLLAMHYFDLYFLSMPEFSNALNTPDLFPLSLIDLCTFLGIGGLYLAGCARTARGHSLVPLKDPRLNESLAFENF